MNKDRRREHDDGTARFHHTFEKVQNKRLFGHLKVDYDTEEVNSKLKSLYDLIALYAETNTKEI
jgi:hypothetical protein